MGPAIVCDSTADIDLSEGESLGISIVPLFVNFGEHRWRDLYDLSRADFYHKLETEKVLPTSSQPTSAMFEDAFRPPVAAGRDIICITISGGLSGTINAARAAATQFPAARIELFDSLSASAGTGMLVLRAQELAASGRSTDEVLGELERLRTRQSLFATLPDLSHAVRTGRVSRAQAMIGGMMKIVPVLKLDAVGKVAEEARVRTFARSQEAIVASTVRELDAFGGDSEISVVHAGSPEVAAALRERILAALPAPPVRVRTLATGPVIATHAGIGAVAIFSLAR